MIYLLSTILFIIFVTLGSFHFYWFFGGKWGLENVIPTKENALKNIEIPKIATLLVGFILLVFGLFYLVPLKMLGLQLPNWIINFSYWFIPTLFVLRAIGDFKYVGFFKKIKKTSFAKSDTKLFSPLCLCIGCIGFLIQLIK